MNRKPEEIGYLRAGCIETELRNIANAKQICHMTDVGYLDKVVNKIRTGKKIDLDEIEEAEYICKEILNRLEIERGLLNG